MQYKIPVHIENEDKIIGPFSLRQLIIMTVFGGIGYSVFKSLVQSFPEEIALAPGILITLVGVFIAMVNIHHMSFLPLVLNSIRLNVNAKERHWQMGVDSFSPLEVGYIETGTIKEEITVEGESTHKKVTAMEDSLDKL